MKKPKSYRSLAAIAKAAQEGTLPKGFTLYIDNDCVTGLADNPADENEPHLLFDFDDSPRRLLEQALKLLKIPFDHV